MADALTIVCSIIYAVILLFCLGSCIFVYWYRKTVIVALGQPVYLYQLCLGGILIVSPIISMIIFISNMHEHATLTNTYITVNGTTIPLLDETAAHIFNSTEEGFDAVYNNVTIHLDTLSVTQQIGWNIGCNAIFLLAWIGIIINNTVLFTKVYRVYKVTLFRRHQTIKPCNVLGPYILAVVVSVTIFIALTITSPVKLNTMIDVELPTPVNRCYGFEKVNLSMFGVNTIIDMGILVLAWKVRHTDEELGESLKYVILISMLSVMDIILIILFSFWSMGITNSINITIFVIMILKALAPIVVLICPRMYYIWYEKQWGNLPAHVQIPGRRNIRVGGIENSVTNNDNNTTANVAIPTINHNRDDSP